MDNKNENWIQTFLEKREGLEKEEKDAEEVVSQYKRKLQDLEKMCSHPVVFEFSDNRVRKIGRVSYCFCPICRKVEYIYYMRSLKDSSFKKSRIIPIHQFPLTPDSSLLTIMEEEFITHMDSYLNRNSFVEELSFKMWNCILEQNWDESKILKK